MIQQQQPFNDDALYKFTFYITLTVAAWYASQHTWCLFQARINWEVCGRKGGEERLDGVGIFVAE